MVAVTAARFRPRPEDVEAPALVDDLGSGVGTDFRLGVPEVTATATEINIFNGMYNEMIKKID